MGKRKSQRRDQGHEGPYSDHQWTPDNRQAVWTTEQHNEKDTGEPYQVTETFDGPVRNRSCRDVSFFILFFSFVGVLAGLLINAGRTCDIDRLFSGVDRYGNVCGRQNRPIERVNQSGRDFTSLRFAEPSDVVDGYEIFHQCVYNCSSSYSPLFRRCIPKIIYNVATTAGEILEKITSTNFLKQSVEDIEACWREIIYLCLIALGLALVMTFMLRFLAGVIIWLSIAIVVLGSAGLTAYLWYRWFKLRGDIRKLGDQASDHLNSSLTRWLIYAIVSSVFMGLILLTLLVMRKRIRLVVALFEEAGKAIAAMPLLLLQPFWTFLSLVVFCTLWMAALSCIETSGEPRPDYRGFVYYRLSTVNQVTRWYHVFALLWVTQFIIHCQDLVIAYCVSKWFFTRDKKSFSSPIIVSVGCLMRYHLGSVALGSLIIAVVKVIRILLRVIENRLKESNNSVLKCIMKCIGCCIWCFENFLKFLSRNAYIEIAIYGHSFCKGAQKAFSAISSNALRVSAINSVGDFTLFLTKLGVVLSVVFIGIEIIKAKGEVHQLWVPVTLSALFAFLIAHCFLSVYEMTVDTLFLCFCEDCEMNDGISRPYYMSTSLMKLIRSSRQQLNHMEKIQAAKAAAPEPSAPPMPTVS